MRGVVMLVDLSSYVNGNLGRKAYAGVRPMAILSDTTHDTMSCAVGVDSGVQESMISISSH